MKYLLACALSLAIGFAPRLELAQDGPSLVAPTTLSTNKAGRARFEVKTNCKNVIYLSDDDNLDCDRVFTASDKFVYKVSADKPGSYKIIFVAAANDVPVIAQTLVTYAGPPGPAPAPPTPDPVPPGPAPGNLAKLYVLVIEDTLASKAGRGAYYADQKLLARIREKKWSLRVEDKDVKNALGTTPPDLAPYVKASAGKLPYVFLVNQDGKILAEGQLPSSPSGLLDLIIKVGG